MPPMARDERCTACGGQTWRWTPERGKECIKCHTSDGDTTPGESAKWGKCVHCGGPAILIEGVSPEALFCAFCHRMALSVN